MWPPLANANSRPEFPLLKDLADAYTAIDALALPVVSHCLGFMDAYEYILNFSMTNIKGIQVGTIDSWSDYMTYTQKKLIFAPNFSQWDKYTREIEIVARAAIEKSDKVLDAYNAPRRRLDDRVQEGIYARVRLLKSWINNGLEPTRSQDNYKEWKHNQETTPSTPNR
jgi:hypothetical protein